MRVYIIRHGESENNKKRLCTGWYDASLTDLGREEAKRAASLLDGVTFDRIYSSDLSRAIETARLAIPGCSPKTTPLLREISVGWLAGNPLSVITDEDRAQIAKIGYKAFGGESNEELRERILTFRAELEASGCENVALFTHAGWLRTFFDTVIGMCIPRNVLTCNNCATAIFEYTGNLWRLHSWINLQ